MFVFPAASTAVMVMMVSPRPASVPAAGVCQTVTLVEQLSLATTSPSKSGINAAQLVSAAMVTGAGQVSVGGVLSATVILTVALTVLLAVSVALMVTVVTPRPMTVPAGGFWARVTAEQLSVATVAELVRRLGTVAEQVASAVRVSAAGTFNVGGPSKTTTVKLHDSERLPAASFATTVTVTGVSSVTAEPAAGVCVMVTGAALLSVAVASAVTFGSAQVAAAGTRTVADGQVMVGLMVRR